MKKIDQLKQEGEKVGINIINVNELGSRKYNVDEYKLFAQEIIEHIDGGSDLSRINKLKLRAVLISYILNL